MRSAVCPTDWTHHLLPSGESHQACLSGGISSWTSKIRTDTYDWFGLGFLIVITAKWREWIVFFLQNKKLTRITNIHKHKEGLGWVLPSFVQWTREGFRAIPQARLALACTIISQSHCYTSPSPSAAPAKGNQSRRLCHNRQAAWGQGQLALQGQQLTSSTTLALRDPW